MSTPASLLLVLFGLAAPALDLSEPRARTLARELCEMPRLAGTSGSLWGARYCERLLVAAGWQVELDRREVLLSYPRRQSLALFARESAVNPFWRQSSRFDPDQRPPGDVPPCSGFSASGRVRAEVVDAGYGLRADFERLREAGIDVRGKIVLARYGRAYRGIKVDLASEYGAAGVLLFSDPADDGEAKGELWPQGPWKEEHDGQRGSILPMGREPGDPSTPRGPSPRRGTVVERESGTALDARLPRIPCMPIGARAAQSLRERLTAVVTGDGTEPRPVGPGPAIAELEIEAPRELREIVNLIATLPGTRDEFALAGGHRDTWVRGMHDNGSGIVALLLAAEELGARAAAGWQSPCTLKLGLWDAEEFGLIGSTEWAEAHAALLRERCLFYLNVDAAVSGTRFSASGTPGMLGFVRNTAERVAAIAEAPQSLWQQWSSTAKEGAVDLGLPGSGSDFAVFIHHLGVPTLEIGFGGNSGGQYHARSDDFHFVERYLDPGWVGHALAGHTIAELLVDAGQSSWGAFDEAEASRALAGRARALGGEDWFGVERGERLAQAFERAAESVDAPAAGEQRFFARCQVPGGLAGRVWFKNPFFAPALENGYGAESFPSLRSAAAGGAAALDVELAALVTLLERISGERASAR